ncbi:MAG: hypothetical protein Hyperionvirus25_30 [Hyperionvirus sp.]|uniref:Uncharacterized protein n=1 Tax=Hyperionvirus sp. TaxID=2487770 RepID=A0A3G5ACW2_9VIRU|nr:MAG: hypothetical protein Hyperionvirus25_30 [Hyperionvirus sp.]
MSSSQKTENKSQNAGGAPMVIDCEKIDVKKVSISPLDTKNERLAGQGMSFVNYEFLPKVQKSFIFKTGPIKLVQGGIPQMNDYTSKWCKSDKDREFFKVPCDPNQPNSVALFDMLERLDKHTQECAPGIFGANHNKYKYIKLVKEPFEPEEDDEAKAAGGDEKKKYERLKFCKVKFDTDFNDNRKITTAVFVNENGKPTQHQCPTVTDVEQQMTWGSTARFVIMVSKLWAEKQAKGGKGALKEYSLTMKCLQLEVLQKPDKLGSTKKVFQSSYSFGDVPPEIADPQPTVSVSSGATVAANPATPVQATADSSGSNSEELEEVEVEEEVEEEVEVEEEEVAPPPPKPTAKKTGAKQSARK